MDTSRDLTSKFNQQINTLSGVTDPRQASLIWADAGVWVLPKAKGRKDPNMKGWQNTWVHDARQINKWFDTGFYDGLILKPSPIIRDDGRIAFLIYIDCDGEAVYKAVCNQFPTLRNTRTERTGSGKGYRIFLIVDEIPVNCKGKITRKGILGTDDLGLELYLRTGGVVVAPSIHPETNQRYELINDAPVIHFDNVDPLVEWSLALPAKNDKKKQSNARPVSAGDGNVPSEVSEAIARVLHVERVNSEGWSDGLDCIFHKHEHSGGAGWNVKTNCFKCFKCEQTWNAKETAAALSIDWPKPTSRTKRSVQHRAQNPSNKVETNAERRAEALEAAQKEWASAKATLDDLRAKKKQRAIAKLPRPPLSRIADLTERAAEQARRKLEDELIAVEAQAIKAARAAYKATGDQLATIGSRWQWKRYAPLDTAKDTRKIVEHVSDDLPPAEIEKYRTLLIEGGTGLGKSRAIGDYVNGLPGELRITLVAAFTLLVQGADKYIDNADHYKDATSTYQSMLSIVQRLLTSVTSSPKFDRSASDVLFLEDITGLLRFLVSSDTFKGDEAAIAYRTLKHWATSAKKLIGVDANLSDIEKDWINPLRGNDVVVKRYRLAGTRGTVTLLKNNDIGTWMIKKLLLDERGQVYVASSSEAKTSAFFDLFSGGIYRTIKITRDTSNTPEVARFIEDAEYRKGYDLVIYDPAMPSGVDISESVYALVGIFDRMPLGPESAIQLFGRVRNAQRYYAAVPAESEGYETPTAEQLKADRLNREYWTAKHTGQVITDKGTWLEMLELWSKYQERHLRETARWRHYFVERLQRNGFKVQSHDIGISKEFCAIFTEWRKERKEDDWAFVRGAEGIALPDLELEKVRLGRKEITHELRLRNTRYKIEKVMGSDQVCDQDRDLMSPQNRGALYHAIQRQNENTLEIDANESIDGVPLQKRQYSHLELTTVSKLLGYMGFDGKPAKQDESFIKFFLEERSDIELKERFAVLTDEACTKLFKLLGHQTENANTALGRIKWLLNYLWGVKPQSRRQGRAENRIMLYQLDDDLVTYLLSRRDQAAKAARKKQAEKMYHESTNKTLNRFVVQPQELQIKPVAPLKIGIGMAKFNPFSTSKTAYQGVSA